VAGEESITTRSKVAETNAQIQTLRHQIFDECVAITSSIDTIPRAMVPRAMRARWLQELRRPGQGAARREGRAKTGARSHQEEDPMIAAIDATVRPRSASPT
jgi:hypothetical protein